MYTPMELTSAPKTSRCHRVASSGKTTTTAAVVGRGSSGSAAPAAASGSSRAALAARPAAPPAPSASHSSSSSSPGATSTHSACAGARAGGAKPKPRPSAASASGGRAPRSAPPTSQAGTARSASTEAAAAGATPSAPSLSGSAGPVTSSICTAFGAPLGQPTPGTQPLLIAAAANLARKDTKPSRFIAQPNNVDSGKCDRFSMLTSSMHSIDQGGCQAASIPPLRASKAANACCTHAWLSRCMVPTISPAASPRAALAAFNGCK
mmetsp:Transcript_141593/g.394689  ORF Transcript_141593/g.394689 Transcript_141593/m.394689 type:complete len:265 (-) Transcript_141593:1012-1806(-)